MESNLFQPLKYYNLTIELAHHNAERLNPGSLLEPHPREIEYIEGLRQVINPFLPTKIDYAWFEALKEHGPGQGDKLFPWLAKQATKIQMYWFLKQEAAGEAGFDDLVAMTQVKMPTRAKLELARNYWDEMGNGRESAMHGKLLGDLIRSLGINPLISETVPEALQLANIMMGLAANRRYAYQSIGALGVIEMTAPGRVALVDKGLDRLGVSKKDRSYFTLHATLDVKHSRDWNREIIEPLSHDATIMRAIAEGAYLRLWAGLQCFNRYRAEFLL